MRFEAIKRLKITNNNNPLFKKLLIKHDLKILNIKMLIKYL